MENEAREYFPKVGTTVEQKYFVNEVLLPKMNEAGLIACPNVSDLLRWAIERGAREVGVKLETPTIEKRKPGRKKNGF